MKRFYPVPPASAAASSLVAAFLMALFPVSLVAQSVVSRSTGPVGFVKTVIPAESDGLISAAFHQQADYRGTVASIDDVDRLSFDGADFFPNQFADSHYVLFVDGDREGLWATISGNDANSLNLSFVVQDLGDAPGDRVEVGDRVRIIPFWTPATLIPDAGFGLPVPDGTQLLVFSRAVPGSNVSAIATYEYVSGDGWYDGADEVNDFPIYPDESIVLRNRGNDAIELVQKGSVPMFAYRTVLSSVAQGAGQEIRLTTGLPVPVSIGDLLDPGSAGAGDEIVVFDHTESGQNRAPLFTATYTEGAGWFDGGTDVNDHLLEEGRGFIYRKAPDNSDDVLIRHKPAYQN